MEMQIKDCSTPVLILGVGEHGSTGIMRSLGRLGVKLYATQAPAPFRDPSTVSKYCEKRFVWDFQSNSPEQSIEFLIGVAQRIGRRCILIPSTDELSLFVAEQYSALRGAYLYHAQRPDLVRDLCSKKECHRLATTHGVPVPEMSTPQNRSEFEIFLESAKFPVMLKTCDGARSFRRTGHLGKIIVRSRDELLRLYLEHEDPQQPNFLLQEYIPGGDDTIWMFNGYFNSVSDCPVAFTARKIRQTPVYRGMTSLGICQKNEIVEQTTRRFMAILGYKGILDIGYRFDARDGRYKLLDANPRVGSSFRLFVAENGLDVVRAMYLDLTDQAIPLSLPREGRKWLVETADFKSSFDYWLDGNLSFAEWKSSFRSVEELAYFATDDIKPFVYKCITFIFRALIWVRDRFSRAMSRLFRPNAREVTARRAHIKAT